MTKKRRRKKDRKKGKKRRKDMQGETQPQTDSGKSFPNSNGGARPHKAVASKLQKERTLSRSVTR